MMKRSLLIALLLAGCQSQPIRFYIADDGVRVRGSTHFCLQTIEALLAPEPRDRPVIVKNISDAHGADALELQDRLRAMGFRFVSAEVDGKPAVPTMATEADGELRSCPRRPAPAQAADWN